MHGAWDGVLGFNAPLFERADETGFSKTQNVDYIVQYWLSKNVAKEKLNLGMATYGRSFIMSGNSPAPGAPAKVAGAPGKVSFFFFLF
jgi:chitinase